MSTRSWPPFYQTIIHQPWLDERIKTLPDSDAVFYADLNDNKKSRGGHVDDHEIDLMISQWPEEVREIRIKFAKCVVNEGIAFYI